MEVAQRARMFARKRWRVIDAEDTSASDRAAELARAIGTSPVTAQLLINRGLCECEAARAFLKPTLKDLVEPSLIPGLTDAARIVAQAVRDKKKIVIYGDYDVDGITGSSILWHALKLMGGDVRCYIPHRIDEGYGLNADAVRQLCDEGTQLLITVDCGITAIDPVRVARERGVDVVVTDHHEWKNAVRDEGRVTRDESADAATSSLVPGPSPLLPDANAIVHPRLPGTQYPNPHLCGAGVAFKLAWGVGQQLGGGAGKVSPAMKDFLVEATALAALGTIADVVPLVGENRVLARFGLGCVKASKLNGIRALIASADLDGKNIDSYHVGFLLGPRLNACGRMGHARLAVEMLTDANVMRAEEIASYLEGQNRERQAEEKRILDQAIEQATSLGMHNADHHAIVLGAEGWHPGVIGIVASRLVDRFHKPTVVVAFDGEGHGHGSCRSIAGFHLARALDACTTHLIKHGGHEMAAGLGVTRENFEAFRAAFLVHAKEAIAPEQLVPELRIDTVAGLEHVTHALVDEMSRLGPFGNGNPRPVLACRGVTLTAAPKVVGKKGEHLQLFIRQGNRYMKAIAFNAASMLDKLKPGKPIDLAVEPQLNEWNGQVNVELQVRDIAIPE
jgi:single-stranded-DNA-specific exonuclease